MILQRMHSRTPLFWLFVIFSSLSGCALYDVKMAPTFNASTPASETQGIVIVRVVNTGKIPFPLNLITITPKNLNESTDVIPSQMRAINTVPGKSSIFVSMIDAGEYNLGTLRAFHLLDDAWYDRWIDADITLGTFKVEPGSITDLGTLVYYSKSDGEIYSDLVLRSPNELNGSIINALIPDLNYESRTVIGWRNDELAETRRSTYNSVVQNPTQISSEYLAPDGSLYFLSKLGFILKRSVDGEWSQDAVDTDFDLNTIAANEKGDIVVGGDFGNIFLKRSGGKWQNIVLNRNFTIHEIVFKDNDVINLALSSLHKLDFSTINLSAAEPEIKLVRSMKYHTRWLEYHESLDQTNKTFIDRKPWLIDNVKLIKSNGRDYVHLRAQSGDEYSASSKFSSKLFAVNTDTWQLFDPGDTTDQVDFFLNAGAVELGVKRPGFWSLFSGYSYFRFDKTSSEWTLIERRIDKCTGLKDYVKKCKIDGKSIERYPRFGFLSSPVFSSPQNGTAIVNLYDKDSEDNIVIIETADGGETWIETDHKTPTQYCTTTIPSVYDSLLLGCSGVTSDFYESSDNGENWEHVREHENF